MTGVPRLAARLLHGSGLRGRHCVQCVMTREVAAVPSDGQVGDSMSVTGRCAPALSRQLGNQEGRILLESTR